MVLAPLVASRKLQAASGKLFGVAAASGG